MGHTMGCDEIDCPGESGMVPKKEGGAAVMNGASMKMLTTMGLRICELETLVVRAGDYFAGQKSEALRYDVMVEASRIQGSKKERGAA